MSHKKLQQNISRLVALLLCLMLILTAVPTVHADELTGSCGDKLTWSLVDGTLTIEGSGAMRDYTEHSMAPWYEFRAEIKQLVLPDRLTHVGVLAFYDCYRLTIVDIPDKVKSIGDLAFASSENIQMLDLGDDLQSIGKDAFHGCRALLDLRLPKSLQSIGNQAFYDCSSIRSVVIPAGVKTLGSATFAYCTSLVRAEVQTKLTKLPDWTFFGCSQLETLILPDTIKETGNAALRNCNMLHTVSYGGNDLSMNQLKEIITEDVPGFGSTGYITNEDTGSSAISGTATDNPDGTITEQITTVTNGENSSVSATIEQVFREDADNSVTSNVTVTIENDKGWEDAMQSVGTALDDLADREQDGTAVEGSNITVYIKDSDNLDQSFVDSLAGRDVELEVVTKDGSSWTIDCGNMQKDSLSGSYDLRYTLEQADKTALDRMGVTQGYRLRFASDGIVDAEVKLLLPDSAIRQRATLFKEESGELTQYQSVVVDAEGFVHLLLGSVEGKADYYLGINVPDTKNEAVVPDTLKQDYPAINHEAPIQYEITGRSSSWGMELGQVMSILAVVMVSVIAVVGVVMFIWNKRRLKAGYVPDWDDDDE